MINPVEIINFSVIEPAISVKAFEIHYKQHYLQYVNKLNVLIKDTIFDSLSVEQIINNSEKEARFIIMQPKFGTMKDF